MLESLFDNCIEDVVITVNTVLTADLHAKTLTIADGVTLNLNYRRLFVKEGPVDFSKIEMNCNKVKKEEATRHT